MKRSSILLTVLLVVLIGIAPLAFKPAAAQEEAAQLVVWADETRAPIIEELGAAFQEEYGVEIVVNELGFGDIRDQLKVAGPAGEGPDVLIGGHDWLGELVISGLLAPIDLGDKVELFVPASIQAFTWDGQLYGLPYATENIAYVINTDLIEDCPATWEDVTTVSQELADSGEAQYGFALQSGDPYHFFPIQTSFGGYVFGLDEAGNYNPEDVGIDSEGSIEALQWLNDMVRAGYAPDAADQDTVYALFEAGDAASIITGPWALTDHLRGSEIPYKICPFPNEGKPFVGVQGFMVSAFSQDPLLAQAFLTEYVATDETMQAIFDAGDRASAYIPVLEAIEDEDIVAFGEVGGAGLPMPSIPEMSAVWTAWGDAVTLVFQGQSEPAEAFTTAAEQIRTAIAGE